MTTQNTLQFERSNPLLSMTGIARAIALPHEHAAQRFPSFPALERTAVMQFNTPFQWDPPNAESSGLLLRQAAYPLWITRNAGGSTGYYSWFSYAPLPSMNNTRDSIDFNVHLVSAGVGAMSGLDTGAVVTVGFPSTPVNTHPVAALDHTASPYPYFYVPAGCEVTLNLGFSAPFTAVGTIYLDFAEWASPGLEREISVASGMGPGFANGTAALVAAGRNRWLRPLRVRQLDTTNAGGQDPQLTVIVHQVCPVVIVNDAVPYGGSYTFGAMPAAPLLVPASAPVDWATSTLPWRDTRLTAVAALFTNVTKALNKEGTVLAARISPQSRNIWNLTRPDLSAAHPAEKAYLPLQTGLYTYAPPSTDMSSFWDYTYGMYPASTAISSPLPREEIPVVRLDNTSLANAFVVTDSDTGTSLAVNLDWHIEFRSASQLWPIGLSTMTLETLHQAQLALVSAGFFFSNESHMATIQRLVRSLADWAGRYAPAIGMLHPVVGKAVKYSARAITDLVPRPGNTTPNPTSVPTSSGPPPRRRRLRQRRSVTVARPAPKTSSPTPAPTPSSTKRKGGLSMYLDQRAATSQKPPAPLRPVAQRY